MVPLAPATTPATILVVDLDEDAEGPSSPTSRVSAAAS